MSEHNARDLAFELAQTGQPKVCIAVCDDSSKRANVETSVKRELQLQGIPIESIFLDSQDVDLLRLLRARIQGRKNVVFIVHGLAGMGTRPLGEMLAHLNFRRDLLFALSVPILFWVTSDILPVMISRAPDFWSRRTATYYLSQSSVKQILTRLFGQRQAGDDAPDRVSTALQRVLVSESELNRIIEAGSGEAPNTLQTVETVKGGVADLVAEARRAKSFQIALSLWTLTRVDDELYRVASQELSEIRATREALYEDRNDILLEVSERIGNLLNRYGRRVDESMKRRRPVSLRGMFFGEANRAIQHWWHRALEYEEQFELREMSEQEEFDLDFEAEEPYRGDWSQKDYFGELAAENLLSWVERRSQSLPKVFSPAEGKVLRLLYRGVSDPVTIAQRLAIPLAEASELIRTLRTKVRLFLGGTVLDDRDYPSHP